MNRMLTRVIGGAITAIVVITAIGILLTPASPSRSLTLGLIGGTIIAVVNWFLEESRQGNV